MRGQPREVSPSSLTKGRGAAASAEAGIQATAEGASLLSSRQRRPSRLSGKATTGPASTPRRQIVSAVGGNTARPISSASSRDPVIVSTRRRSSPVWSTSSGQLAAVRLAKSRCHEAGVAIGASSGMTRSHPSGSGSNRPQPRQRAASRRMRECVMPRTRISASAAAA